MTTSPEHTCHDEWLQKAREIVCHIHGKSEHRINLANPLFTNDVQLVAEALRDAEAAGRKAALPSRDKFFDEKCSAYGDEFSSVWNDALLEAYDYLASRIEGEK